MAFAIKADIRDAHSASFSFERQKTMYGGKHIATGDLIFVFASENDGGSGLIAVGTVTSMESLPKRQDTVRQTPCVSITVKRMALARRSLGRNALKAFADWGDGRP